MVRVGLPEIIIKLTGINENQIFKDAYAILKIKARKFTENVRLIKPGAATLHGKSSEQMVTCNMILYPGKEAC